MLLVGTGTGPKNTDNIQRKCLRKGHCRHVLLYMYMLAACFGFLSLFPFMRQM